MVGRTLTPAQTEAIRQAAQRSDVCGAMAELYRDLDREIAARTPRCRNRGLCCRFDEFGHELYVTTLEVAYFLALHGPEVQAPCATGIGDGPAYPAQASAGCPYQVNGLCTVRTGRPMGCRIFFCDPDSVAWQGPLTEAFLQRVRRLHEDLGVPYVYAEWRAVLAALARAGAPHPGAERIDPPEPTVDNVARPG